MELKEFYHKFHVWAVDNGPRVVIGLLLFFVGLWFIRLFRSRITRRIHTTGVHSSLQPFFLSLSVTALYAALIFSVLNLIGFQLTFMSTIIGAFGVAAGLALSGTLQNFAGGVLILMLKPFEIDDSIVAQGQDGRVTSIQIFYTVLLTADNKTVIIPNGKLFNEVIVNVTREGKRRLDFEIKLGYAAPVPQVKQIINEAIKAIPAILHEPATRVGVVALEIDGVKFTINVWVEPANFLSTKIELQERIVIGLAAAGVKLPGM
ncbi:mechanosensitive ion channel family protein [Mucilaginibacter sp. ZT4R22]|uniref:Mechanosensitive ion channel family protein n=2 Tax=Mucilaginibacter pankratovii TaxID=2772110 RepID=A0ABR7WVY2_9SPHI|nr:mechanosensitive ion channel family protein [Mucilaginibacter pankratovii]MBD1365599.1 mechanosensitive ion channel family protein [Mucilaginibacter pankratovii]